MCFDGGAVQGDTMIPNKMRTGSSRSIYTYLYAGGQSTVRMCRCVLGDSARPCVPRIASELERVDAGKDRAPEEPCTHIIRITSKTNAMFGKLGDALGTL